MDLGKFAGKHMYRTSTGLALKKTAQTLDNAVAEAKVFQPAGQGAVAEGKKTSPGAYRHLLTGVSYMLQMVVAGGLCIALSFIFGIHAAEQPGTLAAALMEIGSKSALALMVPVLAGFIAFSIADRPGLTPGLVGGMLAVSTGAGFIGGIIAGFLAGYVAELISNKLPLPQSMAALKPILIYSAYRHLDNRSGDDLCGGDAGGQNPDRPDALVAGNGNRECRTAWCYPRRDDVQRHGRPH